MQIAGQTQLLILDDFGLMAPSNHRRSDPLEVLDDRLGSGATVILGQMPVKDRHHYINDPTLAAQSLIGSSTAASSWIYGTNPCAG